MVGNPASLFVCWVKDSLIQPVGLFQRAIVAILRAPTATSQQLDSHLSRFPGSDRSCGPVPGHGLTALHILHATQFSGFGGAGGRLGRLLSVSRYYVAGLRRYWDCGGCSAARRLGSSEAPERTPTGQEGWVPRQLERGSGAMVPRRSQQHSSNVLNTLQGERLLSQRAAHCQLRL